MRASGPALVRSNFAVLGVGIMAHTFFWRTETRSGDY